MLTRVALLLGAGSAVAQVADQGNWISVNCVGPAPTDPGPYHSSVSVGSKFYVTSGAVSTSVHVLDTDINTWSDFGPSSSVPFGYPVVQLVGGALYLFGGNINATPYNSLRVLYPSDTTRTWANASTDATIDPRNGHTLNAVGSFVYVFGGWDLQTQYFDKIWSLDTAELQRGRQSSWKQSAATGPHARNSHTTVEYAGSLYVFGGFSHNMSRGPAVQCTNALDDCRLYNDLWRYSPLSDSWTMLDPQGSRPPQRKDHLAVVVDDQLVIYGGMQVVGSGPIYDWTQDTYIYSFTNNAWTELKPSGQTPPKARLAGSGIGRQIYGWSSGQAVWRFTLPVAKDSQNSCGTITTTHLGTALGFNLVFIILLVILAIWRLKKSSSGASGGSVNDYSSH